MQASQYSGNGSSSRQKRQSSSLGRSIGYKRSRTQCNDDRVWSNQYDPDTNQCYREATCSAQPAGNPVSAWLRQKNQHPSGSVPTSSTVIGARSLRKMCLHTIANHTDQFDNIDGLDWRFGKDIWQFLFHRCHATVKIWAMFANEFCLLEDLPPSLKNCDFTRQILTTDFIKTIPYLSPPDCRWLTILSIYEPMSRSQWMSLAELSNLSTLLVCECSQDSGLTSAVVRNWGYDAREHGSFAKLSLLMLDGVQGGLELYLDAIAMLPLIKACSIQNRYSSRPHKQKLSSDCLSRERWERGTSLTTELDVIYRDRKASLLRSALFDYHAVIQKYLGKDHICQGKGMLPMAPTLNVRLGSDRRLADLSQSRNIWYELKSSKPSIEEQMHLTPTLTAPGPAQRNVRTDRQKDLGNLLRSLS